MSCRRGGEKTCQPMITYVKIVGTDFPCFCASVKKIEPGVLNAAVQTSTNFLPASYIQSRGEVLPAAAAVETVALAQDADFQDSRKDGLKMEVPGNYLPAWEETLAKFAAANPVKMAELSLADFDPGSNTFTITYFNKPYRVSFPEGRFQALAGEHAPALSDRIIILQYLSGACGPSYLGGWLTFKELPGGMLHNAPFIREALQPLAQSIGNDMALLEDACLALGGAKLDLGNASYKVPALPKIPLAAVYWSGEQKAANYNILFDRSASLHLDTATLYMLGINFSLAIQQLVKRKKNTG